MFTDPILNQLIEKYPAPTFTDRSDFLFEDLVEFVISQQLSIKAADTIFKRFKDQFREKRVAAVERLPLARSLLAEGAKRASAEGKPLTGPWVDFPNPQGVLAIDDQSLRDCGISFQKISYIKSIADAFLSGLIDMQKIRTMTDEEVIQHLTQIRGVGKWTAEMILIITLKRPDVFSIGDLGIRKAITNLYGLTDREAMTQLSQNWKPYRSTACWYLWRYLENS